VLERHADVGLLHTLLDQIGQQQGQLESFCDVRVGDNLVEKLSVSVVVRDYFLLPSRFVSDPF